MKWLVRVVSKLCYSAYARLKSEAWSVSNAQSYWSIRRFRSSSPPGYKDDSSRLERQALKARAGSGVRVACVKSSKQKLPSPLQTALNLVKKSRTSHMIATGAFNGSGDALHVQFVAGKVQMRFRFWRAWLTCLTTATITISFSQPEMQSLQPCGRCATIPTNIRNEPCQVNLRRRMIPHHQPPWPISDQELGQTFPVFRTPG